MICPAPLKSVFNFQTGAGGLRRLQIWESGRFGARRQGDAAMPNRGCPDSERAAFDALGARE